MEYVIALLIALLIVVVIVRPVLRIVTINDYQRGLRFRGGRLIGLVSPGTHGALRPYSDILVLDGRPTSLTVPGQEILTTDGVALKVSLTARYVVADPIAAFINDQSYVSALYLELHAALRDAIATRTVDDVLTTRADIGAEIAGGVASDLARIGVELLQVDVRDVMVPGELKRAFAGIVAARREGEIALERARGETAALRSLANAGRMLDDNPGLLQLRVLQQLGSTSGNTVMLGLGGADGRPPGPPPPPRPAADRGPEDEATRPSDGGPARPRATRRPPVTG
jgi:regulator of protease activity HflC (stomatin/prohibitin superfamily)